MSKAIESPPVLQGKAPTFFPFPAGFVRVLVVQLAFGITYSAFLLLPKYLATELGASAAEIGRVSGSALVVAAVFSPFIGYLTGKVSRRLLLGVALFLGGAAGLGFLFAPSIGPLIYVLRAAQGLAWVMVFNLTATLVADLVPKQHLSRAIGLLGVSMLVTNALAPAVVEPVATHFGWAVAFGVPSLLGLCAIFLVAKVPNGPVLQQNDAAPLKKTKSLLPVHYTSLLMGGGIGVMFTFTQPFALSLGASRVGDFFLGYVALALLVRVGLAGLADRVGPGKVAASSLALYAVVVGGAGELTPDLLFWFGAGLGASHGFLYPALVATGMAELSPAERPVFMGWTAFAFNAGFAIAVLGLGPLADRLGYPFVFRLVGVALASGILPLALSQGLLSRNHLQAGPKVRT